MLRGIFGSGGGSPVGGTGTTNTIPRWTGASTLGDSGLIDDGSVIYTTARNAAFGSTSSAGYRARVLAAAGAGSAFGLRIDAGTNSTDYALRIANQATTSDYLAVRGDGNVGIGTATPNSTAGIGLTIYQAAAGSLYLQNATDIARIFQQPTNLYIDSSVGSASGSIIFRRGSTVTESARIDSAGNFGIGTASPTNNGAGTQTLMVNGSTTGVYDLGVTGARQGSWFYSGGSVNIGSIANVPFALVQNATIRWSINTSGHFLAGTDNTYDIGASGATRPRTVYAGTSIIVGPSATAAGTNANAIGQSCSATGANSASIGQGCTAAGQNSSVLGASSRADGFGSCAVGYAVQTSANGSFALASGFQSLASLYGAHSHGSGNFAALGDAQKTLLVARVQTTNATATNLWLNGTSTRLAMPNSTAWAADVHLVARSATGAGHAYFVRRVLIKRDANAASTALVGTVQTIGTDIGSNAGAPPAGWAIAITADTTNGALDLQVTGALATTINWVARVELVEVSLA